MKIEQIRKTATFSGRWPRELCYSPVCWYYQDGCLYIDIGAPGSGAQTESLDSLLPRVRHIFVNRGLSLLKQKPFSRFPNLESVTLLNRYFPGCAVTTDMIVAFPGETEEEFAESLAFIRKCRFADMHIFPYSRRPGTPADKMPGQHNNDTKESRSRAAIAVAEEMSLAYRQNLVGTTHAVLFEEMDGEFFTGHAPNYVKVYAEGENLHNEIRNVEITGVYKDGVLGVIR